MEIRQLDPTTAFAKPKFVIVIGKRNSGTSTLCCNLLQVHAAQIASERVAVFCDHATTPIYTSHVSSRCVFPMSLDIMEQQLSRICEEQRVMMRNVRWNQTAIEHLVREVFVQAAGPMSKLICSYLPAYREPYLIIMDGCHTDDSTPIWKWKKQTRLQQCLMQFLLCAAHLNVTCILKSPCTMDLPRAVRQNAHLVFLGPERSTTLLRRTYEEFGNSTQNNLDAPLFSMLLDQATANVGGFLVVTRENPRHCEFLWFQTKTVK